MTSAKNKKSITSQTSNPEPAKTNAEQQPIDLRVATAPRQEEAYAALLPAARALDASKLLQLNTDLPLTSSTAIAVARRMREARDFLAKLPGFDIECLDGLECAGLALSVAHGDYRRTTEPSDALAPLVTRGFEVRTILVTAGEALANAGMFNRAEVEKLRAGVSHSELQSALIGLVRAYHAADWALIKTRSALTDEILDEAETISQRMLAILGDRDVSPEQIAEVTDIRQRMYTICVLRYDQVRRAATYMRWDEDDAEEYVPSLYLRGPRKPRKDPVVPVTPANAPVVAKPVTQPAVVAAKKKEVGDPDSGPFTS